ncbi:alpha-L-rhamnosidase-related protein [Mucilaginibacter glaciei]|uniref:Alpha-L-rhamnosidase N-terminal domain-containing protein n=1 Tax=Mucilaginibacter glaciei TaxID=2772109 RepID=A0A926S647_9SPHI|nr:alpha-L-rhamnosidase C-terminal domain-containing protein [Mucilaginibacter glaciei]MBD1393386.1 alpha-L-rhamnosidase N-terminal domain-containing protein [Mucilaginibacter glaciei]
MTYHRYKNVVCSGVGLLLFAFSMVANAQDRVSKILDKSYIWNAVDTTKRGDLHVVFRKSFTLTDTKAPATLNLFAYNRFAVFINGEYLMRGPVRFENKGPQYANANISSYLKKGTNTVVVVVHRFDHTGQIMAHEAGFTALIELKGATNRQIKTDASWKVMPELSYTERPFAWSSIRENIDARKMPTGYTSGTFNDELWDNAVKVKNVANFFPLRKQELPFQQETVISNLTINGKPANGQLPLTIKKGDTLKVTLPDYYQAYLNLDLDAKEGVVLRLFDKDGELNNSYTTRNGLQNYTTYDTYGIKHFTIYTANGELKLNRLSVTERRYPFKRTGSFTSSDKMLNTLWDRLTRSLQILSEDAYDDCADRERVEWMDCDPPAFDVTRTAMQGPDLNGKKMYADARLLKEMLRRTALTQTPDGRVKAHTASDRWDIHGYMEDRTCDWVEGARRYYETTGDKAFIKELWVPITRQLNWFLARRTVRGLVKAREWEVSTNPLRYQVCEGTGLNAFIYKALADAAYLGIVIGKNKEATFLANAATKLRVAINKHLWDKSKGTYYSGYMDDEAAAKKLFAAQHMNISIKDGYAEPTFEAAVFAVDQAVVPAARLDSVKQFMKGKWDKPYCFMTYYYSFKQMYAENKVKTDEKVLDMIRERWQPALDYDWQTAWEHYFEEGSKVHIYGIHPAYFLSSYVLGVRPDGPVWTKKIVIEPHLGDLKYASGNVGTEFGNVAVAWTKTDTGMTFTADVPKGVTATLKLNGEHEIARLELNHKKAALKKAGDQYTTILSGGKWVGTVDYKN